jgi:hypothetical protein
MCQRAMKTRFDRSEIRKRQKVASLSAQALILQRHFALPGSAASILGTLQRSLIIFATY